MNLDELVQNTDANQQTGGVQPVVSPQVNNPQSVNPQAVQPVQVSTPPSVNNQQVNSQWYVASVNNQVPVQNPANNIPAQTPQQVPQNPQPVQVPAGANPFVVPPVQNSAPQNINVTVNWANEKITVESWKKKFRKNGIFRILTLFTLFWVGILSLLDAIHVFQLNIEWFALNQIYALVVILSVPVLFWYKGFFAKIVGLVLFVLVVWWIWTIWIYHSLVPDENSIFDDTFAYAQTFPWDAVVHLNTYFWDYMLNGSDTQHLLEWIYNSDRMLIAETGFTNEWKAYLYLQEDSNWNILQNLKSDLMLDLSKEKTFDLYAKNFIGKYNVNLDWVKWKNLKLHWWIWDYNITLWSQLEDDAELELKSARSDFNLNVPKNVWVKLYYKQIAGSIELTNFKASETEKNYYESLNIDTAKDVVEINVNVGIGKFTLNWID